MVGLTRTRNVEGDVHTARGVHARINFVLQPVVGNLSPYRVHIPPEAAAEIARATGKTQAAPRVGSGEGTVRPAYRSSLSEGNLVVLFLRNFFRRRLLLRRFLLPFLLGFALRNRN